MVVREDDADCGDVAEGGLRVWEHGSGVCSSLVRIRNASLQLRAVWGSECLGRQSLSGRAQWESFSARSGFRIHVRRCPPGPMWWGRACMGDFDDVCFPAFVVGPAKAPSDTYRYAVTLNLSLSLERPAAENTSISEAVWSRGFHPKPPEPSVTLTRPKITLLPIPCCQLEHHDACRQPSFFVQTPVANLNFSELPSLDLEPPLAA